MIRTLLAIVLTPTLSVAAHAAQPPFAAVVVTIADGDSFTARRDDGRLVRIRLHTVDAPEVTHGRRQVDQPYGGQAREWAQEELQGERVTIHPKGASYGRMVAAVTQAEGTDYGLDIVTAGLAWTDPRYKPSKKLRDAEAEAKQERRGLWQGQAPIEPKAWRKLTREQQRKRSKAA